VFYGIVPELGYVLIEYIKGKTKRKIGLKTALRAGNYRFEAYEGEIGKQYTIGKGNDKEPVILLSIEIEKYQAMIYSEITKHVVYVPLDYELYTDVDGDIVKQRKIAMKKKVTKWDI
jgi:hypothetical protein